MPSLIFATQTPRKNMNKASQEVPTSNNFMPQVIVATSGILTIIIIALIVYGNIKFKSLNKKIKFEKFKTKQLEKKLN